MKVLFSFLLIFFFSCAEGLPLPFPEETGVPELFFSTDASPSVAIADGSSYSCGTIASDTGVITSFLIQNKGSGNLIINSVSVTGGGDNAFSLNEDANLFAGKIIAPGSSQTLSIVFEWGLSPGGKTGQIRILSNDPNIASYLLNLTGTVVSP